MTADAGITRRLRSTAAFALLPLMLAAMLALAGMREHAAQLQALGAAAREQHFAQQVVQAAARGATADAATAGALRQALLQSRADAPLLQPLQAVRELREPLAAWQAASARLQPLAELLLQRIDQGGDGMPVAQAVQAEAGDAIAAARALQQAQHQQVLADGQQRWRVVLAVLLVGAVLVLALVLLAPPAVQASAGSAAPAALPAPSGDQLTGLPPPALLVERLRRAGDHAARHPGYGYALLFIDVDHLGDINERLGRPAGDELLRQVADRIEDTLRPGDVVARVASGLPVAARTGGDEFAVVLEGVTDAAEALAVAQRLIDALALPYPLGTEMVAAGASIGIALGQAGASPQALLHDADIAMLQAKRSGRGRAAVHDPAMRQRIAQALLTAADLRRALDDGAFFVAWQPVLDLDSGDVVAVEALLRWRHPAQGPVDASEFLPAADEAGLLPAIGERMQDEAAAQFAAWQHELGTAAPPRLVINVSLSELQRPGAADALVQRLQRHGVAPVQAQIDVPEAVVTVDDAELRATLQACRDAGLTLALDDFGSGRASLSSLHRLPVGVVKIDQALVGSAEAVEYHRVLVEATIRVAHTLGMATVAEGVATAEQAALVQSLQCRCAQGAHYAAPMAAADLARWLTERQEAQPVSG